MLSYSGKHPSIKWKDRATTDRERIERFLRPSSRDGIAAATGDGFLVLDFDPRNGGLDSLDRIEREHGTFPDTAKVLTGEYEGDRGIHIWMRTPPGVVVRSRSLAGFDGIDVKAHGGVAILPPTRHKSSVTYEVAVPFSQMVDAPAWVLHLVGTEDETTYETAEGRAPSGRPLSSRIRRYLRSGGIPVGEQRSVACRMARALLEVPYDVETSAEALFGALSMSDEDESKGPWTYEECLALVQSIDRAPRPNLKGRRGR